MHRKYPSQCLKVFVAVPSKFIPNPAPWSPILQNTTWPEMALYCPVFAAFLPSIISTLSYQSHLVTMHCFDFGMNFYSRWFLPCLPTQCTANLGSMRDSKLTYCLFLKVSANVISRCYFLPIETYVLQLASLVIPLYLHAQQRFVNCLHGL